MGRTTVRSEQVKDKNLLVDDLRDFAVSAVTGLDISVAAGRVRNGTTITDQSAQPLTLTNNTTSYVEITSAGVASSNTTGFTTGRIPLATVVTSGGAVTAINDKRAWVVVDNNDGGSGTAPGSLSDTNKETWISLARTKIIEDQTASRSYGTVGNLRVDVFTDNTGLDGTLSSGYTHRATPNFDVIATISSLNLFRPIDIPTNLQGYWRLNEGGNIGNPTPSGNVQIDTAQSVLGGASGLFDGSGDYLTFSNSDNFNFEGDFTLEWRMRAATIGTNQGLLYKGAGSGFSPIRADFDTGTLTIYFSLDGASWKDWVSTSLSATTWYAIAVVRSGSTITLYKDGVSVDTATVGGPLWVNSDNFVIGSYQNVKYYDGHLDEMRFSRVARYTANYTPAVSAFVNDADTQLLLHFDGADGSTTFTNSCDGTRFDETSNNNDLADNNTVLVSPQDYWKATGEGSADFEATNSEYLSITDGAQVGLDITGSISLSAFVKIESAGGADKPVLTKWDESLGSQKSYDFGVSIADKVYFNGSSNGSAEVNAVGTTTLSVGKWYHIACVYNGTFIILYVNGNVDSVTAYSSGLFASTSPFWIGRQRRSVYAYCDGLVKDPAIWSSALTPLQIKSIALGVDLTQFGFRPNDTSLPTPTVYWKLNEISSAAGAISRAATVGSHTLTDNNTVGTGAGYVEGAGADFEKDNSEYLSAADSADWSAGSGNYTLAVWVKYETVPSGSHEFHIFGQNQDGNNYIGWWANVNQISLRQFEGGALTISLDFPYTWATGVWYHITLRKTGNDYECFVDGQKIGTTLTDATPWADFTGSLWIGRSGTGSASYADGLMSDYAIWKGTALTNAQIASLACGIPLQQAGIVSYWKLNETSGNRVDSIGSNTLVDNNTVLSASGKVGNGADFVSANSEYLSITDASQIRLEPTGGMLSILTWARTDTASGQQALVAKGDGGAGSYILYFDGVNNIVGIVDGTSVSHAGPPDAGVFYHSALIADGARLKLYTDSVIQGDVAKSLPSFGNAIQFTLGARDSAGVGSYLDGLMDETILAGRWFRDEEIKTVYNKGLNAKEATSTEIAPSSGNAKLMSVSFTTSFVPDRAMIIANKTVNTGSVTLYASRVASPGTDFTDTTKWTPITENTITDITGQTSGSTCRFGVAITGDAEIDDIAIVFGQIGGSGGGSGASTSERHFSAGLMGG